MVSIMKNKLRNESLEELFIPKWPVGCRRITPGVNYLETFASDKVDVVFGDIRQITENGCVSNDGKEYPVDVLICATGFETSYKPRFPIIGSSGICLSEAWAEEPKSYLGISAHEFPNYFMFGGPTSPVGGGPVLIMIDENIQSFSPKKEAVDDFVEWKDDLMNHMFMVQANSASGKVTALWPGSMLHYLEAIAEPRYEDWDFKYEGNRFNFLGNGYSQTEKDTTADWAYYIRNADDGPYLSLSKSGTVIRPPAEPVVLF
ncbi:hypothetical protein CPB84DRAFT_1775871 [Gymnopilus junonius]|uniref:Sterigmatocystin biosynthesis monooxygenase stcW n=1 Tax=Gymnopilus junonius TaxID=109634 RepID=A0A9P5NMN6_GYMJU|nr:hypothetical protein CPB84DRAFT_1775871 [Gymnopilus junonius]